MRKCAKENVCENRGRFLEFLLELSRTPKTVRRFARSAASFAGVRGAFDHIEEKIVVTARGVGVLGGVERLVFHAKPAFWIDLHIAGLGVAPKMKVQTHSLVSALSDSSHLVHRPVAEHCLAVNVSL